MNGARRRLLQGIAAIAVVVAGAWFAVVEVRQRFTHVHETDARVAGDLVTVSARVAGRLVEFAVASGDRVERDQLIARIDAREPFLLLEQLEARFDASRAERERLAAERTLVDEQTRSRLETARSAHRAAQTRTRGRCFTVGSGPSAVPPPGALRCSRARIRAGTSPRSPSGCRCVSKSSRPASVWRRE